MKNFSKTAFLLAISLIALSVAGCSNNTELYANSKLAFKLCVDNGGVPIQSLFDENILSNCIYKPVGK